MSDVADVRLCQASGSGRRRFGKEKRQTFQYLMT